MIKIESLIVRKGEDSLAKSSLTLKSVREFRSFRVKKREYMKVCISWCMCRAFWTLNPCDKTDNVILTNIIKITSYLK